MTLKVNFWNNKVTLVTFLDNDDETPDIVNYSNVFLRDASLSPECVEKASGLKLFSTGSIPRNVEPKVPPKVITKDGESYLEIHWSDDNVSEYSEAFLKKYATNANRRKDRFYEDNEELWIGSQMESIKPKLIVSYNEFMNDEKALLRTFTSLNHYGISFVTEIPTDGTKEYGKSSFEKIASRIGYLKHTIMGRYFDVVSKKEAENLVMSNKMFHLHQDLLFLQSPPALKLIESVKNEVLEGGENIFVDLFSAARYVLEKDPHAYFALCNVPITFHYVAENGHEFVYLRPLIIEDVEHIDESTGYPYIREINYSPPYQAPFEYGITSPLKKMGEFADWENLEQYHSAKDTGDRYLFRDFHRGLIIFEEFIHDKENQFKVKLETGEAVLFNNRRLAHARTQFTDEEGGSRWFRVGFMDFDVFYSRLRYLYKKYNK